MDQNWTKDEPKFQKWIENVPKMDGKWTKNGSKIDYKTLYFRYDI